MKKLYRKVMSCLNGIATDKQQHFTVSLILCCIFGTIYGLGWGFLITICIGLFKEFIIDKLLMKGNVDYDDIEFDFYGSAAGVVLCVIQLLLSAIFK